MRALAFYLPQFHPVPENDAWWGRGFTEWRNVVQGRPLFPGHDQPQLPADLGFYDLRVPETRAAQADLARANGISGFVYYHYWFQGRRLLERPFDEVLGSGEPDFGFCLCWANEPWTRAWDGLTDEVLVGQAYSEADDEAHMRALLPALADPRAVRIDGKPVFLVYKASALPDPRRTTDTWREICSREGVGELHLLRVEHDRDKGDPRPLGFDAAVDFQPDFANLGPALRRSWPARIGRRLGVGRQAYRTHRIFDYATVVDRMLARPPVDYPRYPCVTPGWDNTVRRRRQGIVLRDATPEVYERWLRTAAAAVPPAREPDLLFVNAWNEWAEGNHLEPSLRWGRAHLEATRRVLLGT